MKAGSVKKLVCSLAVVTLCLLFAEQTILHAHAWETFVVSYQDDDYDDYDDYDDDYDDYDDYDDDDDDYDDYDDYYEEWFFNSGQSPVVYYYNEPETAINETVWFSGWETYPEYQTVSEPTVELSVPQETVTPVQTPVQKPTQTPAQTPAQTPVQVQTPAQDKAMAVLNAVNTARAQYGLSPLAHDGGLQSCADIRANEIVVNFSHTRPDGSTWYSLNPGIMFGENILMSSGAPDADAIVNQWMQSPGHRALILDASFGRAAAAGASGNGNEYWVLEFGY